MARYWIVRRYGKYITDKVTFDTAKDAKAMYDLACKREKQDRPIALFLYNPSARYNKKINSSETMIYYSQKPLPSWPGVKYRNVKDKEKKDKEWDFGVKGDWRPFQG